MRFLVRLMPADTSNDRVLLSVRSLAKSLGAEARNPKWTSYGALEIDIFSPTIADFDLLTAALSPIYKFEFSRDLNVAPKYQTEDQLIDEARGYFNSERYWECHETLESLWRVKVGDEKRYLQGLILLCAAFVHHQKGEKSVALSVLGRAIARLDLPEAYYHGLSVKAIKKKAESVAKAKEFTVFRI